MSEQNIKKIECKTYIEKWICDCGGELKFIGIATAGNPPIYGHRCDKCIKEDSSKDKYPNFIYEPIKEL